MSDEKRVQGVNPSISQGMTSGFLQTMGVVALLALVVWRWNDFISIFLNVLLWIYDALGHVPLVGYNFGLAIILFTILTRVVTWPLNASQLKSAKVMQDLQSDKEWLAIQKKYAKDREKLQMEQMRMYQERGINPFGSCLPLLIQFPMWFAIIQALYRALATSPLTLLELARSIYLWPEKYIHSLSVTSIVPLHSRFLWMDLGRPEYTPVFGFNIPVLVILVGVTAYVQTKLTMPASPNPNDQTAQMTQSMSLMMPLMYIFFASQYLSGFALYLLVSNLLMVVQYAMMGRVNWRNLLPGGSKPAAVKK